MKLEGIIILNTNGLQFIPKYLYEKPSVFRFCKFSSKKKMVIVKIESVLCLVNLHIIAFTIGIPYTTHFQHMLCVNHLLNYK